MTGIWAEKPSTFTGFSSYRLVRPAYDQEEMDAWLDKLRLSFDESMADCHHSLEIAAKKLGEYKERAEKLEAVRNKVAEWDLTHMRDRHAAPSILVDLEKILGVESTDSQQLGTTESKEVRTSEELKKAISDFYQYACKAHSIPLTPYRYNLGLGYEKIMSMLSDKLRSKD